MAFSSRLSGPAPGVAGSGWRAQDAGFAQAQLARAVALEPGEADYAEGLGQLLLQRAQPLVARGAAQREQGDAAGAAATAAQARPLLEQALALHRRAAGLLPNAHSFANSATALLWLGEGETGDAAAARWRDAAAACETALRLDPDSREAAGNLAVARGRLVVPGAP